MSAEQAQRFACIFAHRGTECLAGLETPARTPAPPPTHQYPPPHPTSPLCPLPLPSPTAYTILPCPTQRNTYTVKSCAHIHTCSHLHTETCWQTHIHTHHTETSIHTQAKQNKKNKHIQILKDTQTGAYTHSTLPALFSVRFLPDLYRFIPSSRRRRSWFGQEKSRSGESLAAPRTKAPHRREQSEQGPLFSPFRYFR